MSPARSVVRKIIITTILGLIAFPFTQLLFPDPPGQIAGAAVFAGFVLLVQFLVDFERRLGRVEQELLDTITALQRVVATNRGIHEGLQDLLRSQRQEVSPRVEPPISSGHGGTAVLTDTAEVTIYLSDAGPHTRVERALEDFLALAGATVVARDDPIRGSWFRRMHAKVGGEAMTSAAHAIDTRFVLAPDAAVAKDLMSGLAPVIAALGSVEQAVIRVGALLIVKVDGKLSVCQLTARQQLELDHHPSLSSAPHQILSVLQFGINGSPEPIAELDQP